MTKEEIESKILNDLCYKGHPVFMPRVKVNGLNECDVLSINKNEYLIEFEIKISRSDFRADFKKTSKHRYLSERNSHRMYKKWINGRITNELERCLLIPNRFYYACEPELLKIIDIPEYAGLIYVSDRIVEVKQAPLLHKERADKSVYKALSITASQRLLFGCALMTHKNKKTH